MDNSVILSPELIIFGGTFDPPHRGHQDCIQSVQTLFPQAKLLVVPSFHPPLNAKETKIPSASFEQRLEMCRIAFCEYLPESNIIDLERSLPSPNYTAETLTQIKRLHPSKRLAWVLGLDQLQNFHRWHEPLKILKMASLLVVSRQNQDPAGILNDFKKKLGLKILPVSSDQHHIENYQDLIFIRQKTSPASSRKIREDLLKKQKIPQGWLNKELLRYIIAQNLYAT